MPAEHVDILIVGAGLSGIGAGYYFQKECPSKSYLILEAREAMGGTWDLFRYPGIRSDSDMYTLGYAFKPWVEAKAIADGPSILKYINETAKEYGIDQHIRYQHRVFKAVWSSQQARWTVAVETGSERSLTKITCHFLYLCAGYYNYDAGYTPEFPGRQSFQGTIIHPQHWRSDIDYQDKKVVVIGSGATAVTLVPELAKQARHVTMLQRTPTYIVSMPSRDKWATRFRKLLPSRMAYSLSRWKNVLFGMMFYQVCKLSPGFARKLISKGVKTQLGPDYELKHFDPPYNPWQQRLCLVPDADLFESIKTGKVDVITDTIESFNPTGIRLSSGKQLDADLIVTATGLKLKLMGGMELWVDDQPIKLDEHKVYKGMMLNNVPNMAFAIGYTNASWTLKADLSSQYVCRLINYMDQHHYTSCMPVIKTHQRDEPIMDFTSGYILRDIDHLPKQGSHRPWKLYQNYALDLITLRYGTVSDSMRFQRGSPMQTSHADKSA